MTCAIVSAACEHRSFIERNFTGLVHDVLTGGENASTCSLSSLTLKQHKAAIVAVVREGKHATTVPQPTTATATVEHAPAPICPYCMRACVSVEHEAYATLHFADPEEVKRRDEDAMDQLEAYRRGWPTLRMQARAAPREPQESEEEKRAREIRQRLGWEVPGGTRKT